MGNYVVLQVLGVLGGTGGHGGAGDKKRVLWGTARYCWVLPGTGWYWCAQAVLVST